MFLIIGSTAAKAAIPSWREPKDLDVLVSTEEEKLERSKQRQDVLVIPEIEKYAWSNPNGLVNLDELYTIKVSHSFWELRNGSWNKHMFDAVELKKNGAKLIPELYALFYNVWVSLHGKKKANLELEPDQFFNPNVQRVYEHDSIHATVAYYQNEGPLFNRILRDGHEVAVDRNKFEAMSLEDKFKLVREEVYATALERVIIPSEYKKHPRIAYDYALMRTITSYTKGWFPLFIVENFVELRKPDRNFIAWHKENEHLLVKL